MAEVMFPSSITLGSVGWSMVFAFSLAVCGLIYYLSERSREKAIHLHIIQREGCQPLRLVPNKWFPPFGLDKLRKVTEAERTKTYPLLMLTDHEKIGDTYAQWGGSLYTVITRDTGNIRAMLSGQFKSFEVGSGRHGCVLPLLGDGIFTQDGSKWEASRKLLAPMIQKPTLPDLNLIERHFQLLQKQIRPGSSSDTLSTAPAVEMKGPLLDFTLKLTTEFLLGENVDSTATASRSAKWTDEFAAKYNVALHWISKRERLKIFYWMVDSFEFRSSCGAAHNLVDELLRRSIDEHKMEAVSSASTGSYVALQSLLHQGRDPALVRAQFMNILLAGRDTSGSLLCWMLYALAREPVLAVTLRKEVEDILGPDESRAPDKKELNAMIKLDQFTCEVLRLFPPVPINGRFSTENTHLPHGGGQDGKAPILIPSGTLIAFSTFAVHRNRDLYGEDASRFRIERWDDQKTKERRMVDWSYHPFIGGPRKCLGERFAVTQAKYLTCRMLQHYEQIVPTDEAGNALTFGPDRSWVDDVKYHVSLTMMPDAGVWLRLVPKT